ncbi:MAG: lysozyme inhibitor LprI family protein [Acidimicrobiales bacterium]
MSTRVVATIGGLVIVVAAFLLGHEFSRQPSPAKSSPPTTVITVPILRENFTLLACSQSNTLGLEGCAEHQIVALDAQINSLRRRVYSSLAFVGARRNFVNGEVSWTSYRSSLCLSESSVYQGGSLAPVAYANCLVSSDRRHLSALQQFVQELSHP